MTPTGPSPWHGPGLTDVRMMTVAHSAFRREFTLAARLVHRAQPGDRHRIAIVADHLTLSLDLLRHHDELEDELLWPTLATRVAPDLAPIVRLMAVQHAAIAEYIARAERLVATWRQSASDTTTATLAATLASLADVLTTHLDTEEANALPLLAQYLTQAEWAAFTGRGLDGVPPSMRSVVLGMMLYDGDPDAVTAAMAAMPWPLRRLMLAAARRSFAGYAHTIHGTNTPEHAVP